MRLAVTLSVILCAALAASDSSSLLAGSTRLVSPPGVSGQIPFDPHILVDQFGYRPADAKVAVLRDPQAGFDAAEHFIPGDDYQVCDATDGHPVYSGKPVAWKQGATEASAGDRGWWFDFSGLRTPGTYYVLDATKKVRSATFRIDAAVYKSILKAAVRTYYYQRSGFAKRRPYAEACWVDDAAYLGKDQDLAARDITSPDNPAKWRDLSGGWFDAGDTNKYVTFAAAPVHQLLSAYEEAPTAFTDDYSLPESGNGIPDLLDEVKWETDWLKKMQYPDGSAALKVGEIVYANAAPPSSDTNTRYFVPSCSSATIALAGMLAHAAYVYDTVGGLKGEVGELRSRARRAWVNYQGIHPKQTRCDEDKVHAGNADWNEEDQNAGAVVAAVYLYAATGEAEFNDFVKQHYRDKGNRPYRDIGWTRYQPEQGEALLFYARLAQADPQVRSAILADKLGDATADTHFYRFKADDDLYRAFLHDPQYSWGSNYIRAQYGNSNLDMVTYGMDSANQADYELRAQGILHYLHGVNPFAMVYLSNMYGYGAQRSANEIFHAWYARGSRWSNAMTSACGPAPGYMPGGPNGLANQLGVPRTLVPPTGQPMQKAYRDWNVGWPEYAFTITEPAIYYQAAYVKLLSKFAR